MTVLGDGPWNNKYPGLNQNFNKTFEKGVTVIICYKEPSSQSSLLFEHSILNQVHF